MIGGLILWPVAPGTGGGPASLFFGGSFGNLIDFGMIGNVGAGGNFGSVSAVAAPQRGAPLAARDLLDLTSEAVPMTWQSVPPKLSDMPSEGAAAPIIETVSTSDATFAAAPFTFDLFTLGASFDSDAIT